MLNFAHSGGAGDVLYSLYSVKKLCVAHKSACNFYLKRSNVFNNTVDAYETLRKFLLFQDYINEVYPVEATSSFSDWSFDFPFYDLDKFRHHANNATNLVTCHVRCCNLEEHDAYEPWLLLPQVQLVQEPYVLINRTPRYRLHSGDSLWEKVLQRYSNTKKYFVGLSEEYEDFVKKFKVEVQHYVVRDLYDVAALVHYAEVTLCNPSSTLALCVGSGVKFAVEADNTWGRVVLTSNLSNAVMEV